MKRIDWLVCSILVVGIAPSVGCKTTPGAVKDPPPVEVSESAEATSPVDAAYQGLFTSAHVDAEDAMVKVTFDAFMEQFGGELSEAARATIESCQGDVCLPEAKIDFLESSDLSGLRGELALALKGCVGNGVAACSHAATMYQYVSLELEDDPKRGLVGADVSSEELDRKHLDFRSRACRLDETRASCGSWADHALGDAERSQEVELFARLHQEQRCEAGKVEACRSLSWHYEEGGFAGQPEKSLMYAKKGCELSNPESRMCQTYGRMLYTGYGVTADRAAAMTYFEAACPYEKPTWSEYCKGDAATGEEKCDDVAFDEMLFGCMAIARAKEASGDVQNATRLYSALCDRSFIDDYQVIRTEACLLGIEKQASAGNEAARANLSRRYCSSLEMPCLLSPEDENKCPMSPDECRMKYDVAE